MNRIWIGSLALIGLALSACSPQPAAVEASNGPEIAWETDFEAATQRAKAENKPLMVSFSSHSCGYCRQMAVDVFANQNIVGNSDKFVAVHIQTEDQPQVTADFGVSALPVVSFVKPGGEEVLRVAGYVEAPLFRQAMDEALSRCKEEEPQASAKL